MCLYFSYSNNNINNKNGYFTKISSFIFLFLTRAFLICREEQQPYCIDPLWLVSKSSDTSIIFFHFCCDCLVDYFYINM